MPIQLTPFESKLFDTIREFIKSNLPSTTARVAGGWVRDKLLNISSNDIDIVLDTHSGFSFLTMFKEKVTSLNFSNVGVIKVNPEKSKHLETAAILINGVHIDFMQFRSETYSQTRIPSIKEGTIENDVLRRDLTINSLYYNINEEKVEDFIGHSLKDLDSKLLRTPLDPVVTFMDDPLRILRVIRFMVQLKFKVCSNIIDALKNEDVKYALKRKVSNERVGIEIMKMIKVENGYEGMLMIAKHNLILEIFKPIAIEALVIIDNEKLDSNDDENQSFLFSNDKYPIQKIEKFVENFKNCAFSLSIDREIFNIYTILHIFTRYTDNSLAINYGIIKESFKFTKKFAKRILKIEENIRLLKNTELDFDDMKLIITIRSMGYDWLNSFYIYHFIFQTKEIPEICNYILLKGFDKAVMIKSLINGNVIQNALKLDKKDIEKWKEISVALQITKNINETNELLSVLCEYKKNQKKFSFQRN